MKKAAKTQKQLPPENYTKSTTSAPATTPAAGPTILPIGAANVPFTVQG
jgi:hypothetical protein